MGSEPSEEQWVLSIPAGFEIDMDVISMGDTDVLLNEDELCELLKVNSNKCIEHMRISLKEAS